MIKKIDIDQIEAMDLVKGTFNNGGQFQVILGTGIVDHQFDQQPYLNVVISDLIYVRVDNRWHYFCVLVDLFNREIIGYS